MSASDPKADTASLLMSQQAAEELQRLCVDALLLKFAGTKDGLTSRGERSGHGEAGSVTVRTIAGRDSMVALLGFHSFVIPTIKGGAHDAELVQCTLNRQMRSRPTG
jgi:hypothetical protein